MKPFSHLLAVLFALVAGAPFASTLISPDIGSLMQRESVRIFADPTSRRIYAFGFGSLIHGVRFAGLARLEGAS